MAKSKKPAGDALPAKLLLTAASAGELAGIEAALATGAAINARGEYGETALNKAAQSGHLAAVELLVSKGADIENKDGADMTPVMQATVAGHTKVVEFLLSKGAKVTDDLLSTVKMKVGILEENAESGMVREEAVEAWKSFFEFLRTARWKQDWPEIIKGLASSDDAQRKEAADAASTCARRRIDISAGLPLLETLLTDADKETRYNAADAIACHAARRDHWSRVIELLEKGDGDVKAAAISVTVAFGKSGSDLAPMIAALRPLLAAELLDLRHDAALALGYAATNGADASSAIPELAKLIDDKESGVRYIASWSFYRLAKFGADCSSVMARLKELAGGDDEKVAGIASEAVAMIESKAGRGAQ